MANSHLKFCSMQMNVGSCYSADFKHTGYVVTIQIEDSGKEEFYQKEFSNIKDANVFFDAMRLMMETPKQFLELWESKEKK